MISRIVRNSRFTFDYNIVSELEIFEIIREGLWTLLKISAPIMLTALSVGLIISLIQALTQIQEQTLSFVPKIMAIFLSLIFMFSYITSTLTDFSKTLYMKIEEPIHPEIKPTPEPED